MSENTTQPIISLQDTERTPIICEMCFNILNSIHKLLFDSDIEYLSGIEFLNTTLLYTRYFGVKFEEKDGYATDLAKKISVKNIHLTFPIQKKGKPICQIPINELIEKIRPLIRNVNGIHTYDSNKKDDQKKEMFT